MANTFWNLKKASPYRQKKNCFPIPMFKVTMHILAWHLVAKMGSFVMLCFKRLVKASNRAIVFLCMLSDVISNFVGIHSLFFMLWVKMRIYFLWHSSNNTANILFKKTIEHINSDIELDALLVSLPNYPVILKWQPIFLTGGSSISQKSEFSSWYRLNIAK